MALSWNEIKKRAIEFSKEWEDETREHAEAKSFWDGFFHIFGISRKRVASFEEPVKKLGNKRGFIDLFWKGTLLVEHKSKGKSLDKAYQQAIDYFPGLTEKELPQYILVSDFDRFRLYDLEESTQQEFTLDSLHEYIHLFGFIAGYRKKTFKEEDPVNIEAAELMGKLHDQLFEAGYQGHALEVFLVRILFCLFSDDTGIFEKGLFTEYIENKTAEDGSDLGTHLAHLFQILNTPEEQRLKTLDESLVSFPYVNGKLFEEPLPFTAFDSDMREALLTCCYFDWSKISPAIFGSLFQSVMNPERRRNLGAHYTTEQNILKLIKPLFLDNLLSEFERIKHSKKRLADFHSKIASLKFLDPACGCGNFLIITYRELRLLEIAILKQLYTNESGVLDISILSRLNIDSMYGFEVEEFPARIAEVAMWLIDHQMNMKLSEEFGQYFIRLPLKVSANILNCNALRLNWQGVIPKEELSYILGNPPFVGKQHCTAEQSEDMSLIFQNLPGHKVLDYVTAWYLKTAQYIQGTKISVAFVSTNSISQGEQVGVLWQELFSKYHIKIHFAHRTFQWDSEARKKAHVHVVIIGFGNFDIKTKLLYDYGSLSSAPHELKVSNINPCLVEGNDVVVTSRKKPISDTPRMIYGSKPVDDQNLLFSDGEKEDFLAKEPGAEKYFRPILKSRESLRGQNVWVLWLVGADPKDLRSMPLVKERLQRIREFRLKSTKKSVQMQAETPGLFSEIRQPTSNYLLIPQHTSENRKYIPFGFYTPEYILHNSCTALPDATLYHFGILSSSMHMAWVKITCGRIKSDFRYSNTLVYNNYPFPQQVGQNQREQVESNAQKVLDVRKAFPNSSPADLYDPLAMPMELLKAHNKLDKSVDRCYRSQVFQNERQRIEFLFDLYTTYTAPLMGKHERGK